MPIVNLTEQLRVINSCSRFYAITAGFPYIIKKNLANNIAGNIAAKNNIVIINRVEIARIPFQIAFTQQFIQFPP